MAFSTIQGSGGAPDSFVGTLGVDSIVIADSTGNFTLGAQADDDLIVVTNTANTSSSVLANATLKGGGGDDTLQFGESGGTVFEFDTNFLNSIFVNGNKGEDTFEFQGFIGEDQLDVISSTILGGQADDTFAIDDVDFFATSVNGNKDQDEIFAEDSNMERSTIRGGDNDDLIDLDSVFADNSLVAGDLGNDRINVFFDTFRDSTIDGGEGNDTIRVDNFLDESAVLGGAGIDTIDATGTNGDYTLDGGDGTDILISGNGEATLIGGEGIDALTLGAIATNTVLYTSNADFGAVTSAVSTLALAEGDNITGFNNAVGEDKVQIGSIVNGVGSVALDAGAGAAWNFNTNGFQSNTVASVANLDGASAAEFANAINAAIGNITGDAGDVGVYSLAAADGNYLVQVTLGTDRNGDEDITSQDSIALIATVDAQVVADNVGYALA